MRLIIIAFIVVLVSCTPKNLTVESDLDTQSARSLIPNTVAYGLYTNKGEIIKGSTLYRDGGNSLDLIYKFNNNLDEEREYSLLIFNNFKQSPFEVNEKIIKSFNFTVKSNSTINIPFKIELPKSTNELDFVIIKKPNYYLENQNIKTASVLQEVLPLRYKVDSAQKPQISLYRGKQLLKEGDVLDNLFLTESIDDLKVLYTINKNDLVYLSIGNVGKQTIRYAIISLLNWEQVQIAGEDILYTDIEPHSQRIIELNPPEVYKKSNYQFLAFPFPYEVETNNFMSTHEVYTTFRTVVLP